MAIRSRFRSLAERRKQVERNLDEGALGVSHSGTKVDVKVTAVCGPKP
jgi:hypothetical protein